MTEWSSEIAPHLQLGSNIFQVKKEDLSHKTSRTYHCVSLLHSHSLISLHYAFVCYNIGRNTSKRRATFVINT